ncbi:MAG: MMPL family transporter [Deferribacteres bacterium]|nr:MMPL family transporter [Deferribacteres bacterium]
MKKLTDTIIRCRGVVIALLAILTLVLGYEMLRVRLNADFTTYLRQDDPLVRQFNYIGKEYASKSMALVLIEDDVFTPRTLKLIQNLTAAYEELDGVAYVTSLANVLDFRETEWGLEVGRLIRRGKIPQNEEDLKKLRDYVLSKEMYVKKLVSEDGKSTVIVVRLKQGVSEFAVTKEIGRLTGTIAPRPERISYGGMPFLMYNMTLLIVNNLKLLDPLMILLMLVILFMSFRKAGGVFLPMVVVSLSVVWTIGLMTVFNLSLNLLTGLVPIILIAMASADGIHIMRRYYEKRGVGQEPAPAIKETFLELSTPLIITTFTTMIGFLSLLSSNFSIIRQFGIVTALGVLLALVATFLLFPALLVFSRPKGKGRDKAGPPKEFFVLQHVAELVFNHKKAILIFSGLIVIAAATAIPRIEKDVDWSLCLQKGSKPYHAEMLLRRDFGGTLPVQVLVGGDINDPFTLKAMRYLERYLETVPSVGETHSIAGVISEMNNVLNDRYVVPETKEGVANLRFLLEGEDILKQLVKEDDTEALIQAKVDTWHTATMAEAVDAINAFIGSLPEKLVVVETGSIFPEAGEAVFKIRRKRITDNLLLDMKRRRMEVERERLGSIVGTALSEKELTRDGYVRVRRKVEEYLLSNEAEIEAIPPAEAAAMAGDIVERLGRNAGIGEAEILTLAQSAIKQAAPEDLKALAQSLEVVVSEAVGEIRVTSALGKIRRLLPPDSDRVRDLLRDLKGDLWEMNENLVALSMGEYRRLPAIPVSAKVRELAVSFENTGLAAVIKKMEEELVPTQVFSLFIALILVAITLAFIFRSPAAGITGIIPISLTILVNFAVMGYFKISLDSFTAMIASVAIGLGIDTDVHFMSCFKREFSRLGNELKALKKTFSTTGVAILINALTVGLGFAVLLLAGGQHIRRLGGLVALTVLLSALFTFTVLPAVILWIKPEFLRRK